MDVVLYGEVLELEKPEIPILVAYCFLKLAIFTKCMKAKVENSGNGHPAQVYILSHWFVHLRFHCG